MRLCLTGDLMTGRGIDQVLEHPGDPTIHEDWAQSAGDYVMLAEGRSGPIPRRVGADYVGGDALQALQRERPDALVVNLETAVTDCGSPWPGKRIQYRMHPANAAVLTVAGVDVAVLGNNHVLDWSTPGLEQTLQTLHGAGVSTAGAGRDVDEAWKPAVVPTPSGGHAVVLAVGSPSSGIPTSWQADVGRPGVALVPDLSDETVGHIATVVRPSARRGDVVVVSLHWGPNWGYDVRPEQQRFARELIDQAGVHVVHGHSSHHPLGIEVHRGRLILYGCGDLLTDYEGISGHEPYRGELGALYFATIDERTGDLQGLELVPTRVERFRLSTPSADDAHWLAAVLDREGAALGTTVTVDDGHLVVHW